MSGKFNVLVNGSDSPLLEASIDIANSGSNEIVVCGSTQLLCIYKIFWICAAAVTVTPEAASAALTGVMSFSANEGIVLDFDTKPWFTLQGQNFNLNLGGNVQVSGRVYYTLNTPNLI